MTATARIIVKDPTGKKLKGVRIRVLKDRGDFTAPTVIWEGTTTTEETDVNYDETLPQPELGVIKIIGKEGYLERHRKNLRPSPGMSVYNFVLTPIPETYDMSRWKLRESLIAVRPRPSGYVWTGYRDGYDIEVKDSIFHGDNVDGTFMERSVLWIQGKNNRHAHISGTSWITKFLADEEVVPPPTPPTVALPELPLKKRWEEFFANPDVIEAIGLTPSSIHESFALVFTNYSIINDKEQTPETGDYVSVFLIIGGLVLAAAATIMALIPIIKGASILTALKTKIIGAKKVIDLGYIEPGLTAVEGSIKAALAAKYGIGFGILSTMKAEFIAHPLFTLLGISFLVTQMDITGWGFGLLPESIHRRAETLSKAMRGDLIRLDALIKEKQWEEAKTLANQIDVEMYQARKNLEGAPAAFWEKFGFSVDDARAMFDALETSLNAYRSKYPLLGIPLPKFPDEFTLEDVEVIDGDTIVFPDHPDVKNRIRFLGIDTHEIETAAGKVEDEYLRSLIEGKTVTIKTHEHRDPERTFDTIGRLLGGVFIDDKDVVLDMLRKFGKDVLTATKYQKKYRWIDWDEYKREAAKAIPTIAKVKVYTDPAYARLFIDGEDTRKIAMETFELDVGKTYNITARKLGYVGFTQPVTVPPMGTEIRITLKEKAETAKVKVYSSPTRAKLFIDDKDTMKIAIETFELDIGKEYKITAKKKGYKDTSTEITVPLKGIEINIELNKLTEEEEKEEGKFTINIDSVPTNAKLYIDGQYTKHLTPSNEVELSDVIGMLEPGEHTIKAEKAGKSAVVTVNVTESANPDIFLTLVTRGLEPVTVEPPEIPTVPEPEIFKINILSTPSRAKIYVDGIYTHHLTPSDEKELSDVMELLPPGKHLIRATKAGKAVEKEVEIKAGFNEPIYLTLKVVGLLKSRESLVSEIRGYKFIIERLEAELALL